jgi:hypothetical protein
MEEANPVELTMGLRVWESQIYVQRGSGDVVGAAGPNVTRLRPENPISAT